MKRFLRPADAIALVVVALAFAAVAILAVPTASPYTDTFSTHDPEGGGYLAWYRLLARSGVTVERFETHAAALDATIGTLVVANNGDFNQSDVEPLARFVRGGGNLVWVSRGVDERDRAWGPLHFPLWTRAARTHGPIHPIVPSVATRGVHILYGEGASRIAPGAFPPAVPLAGDRRDAVVARYPLGRGRVTIVTDPTLFVNRNLARDDNAQLALSIATQHHGGTVAFDERIHGYGSERSVWSVFPLPLRAATIALGVIALLALAGANLRTVPLALAADDVPPRAGYLQSLATLLRRGRASRHAAGDLASSTFAACGRELGLAGTITERRLVAAYQARGDDGSAREVREIARLLSTSAFGEPELVMVAERCFSLRKGQKDAATRRRRAPAR